ncbi:4Fe-4S dicluster domain-containing protein [Eubacterium aggregans]|uniref:4Fe-4S dicluster domain-containing protein n=1 Tax=Eubacterium aggregans TaxID=81409 RepID=UPI003F2DEF36
MKRGYVNEKWCLGCHLCEVQCAFAGSGESDMVKAFNRDEKPLPRIRVEDGGEADGGIHFAVSCRHCETPLCVKGCITGALSVGEDGIVRIDQESCVGCRTCIVMCPYGCLVIGRNHTMLKCELCTETTEGTPACVAGCPNQAIVYEERGE